MVINGRLLIEVLPLRDLYTDYRSHKRLQVFVHKGRECATCDRVGTLLLVTEDKGGQRHVDLYTDDFVMMTVDHIMPKSQGKKLGWSRRAIEKLRNKQCMCSPCNGAKGSKIITNERLAQSQRDKRKHQSQSPKGVEIIRKLVYNENIFNRNLEGVI